MGKKTALQRQEQIMTPSGQMWNTCNCLSFTQYLRITPTSGFQPFHTWGPTAEREELFWGPRRQKSPAAQANFTKITACTIIIHPEVGIGVSVELFRGLAWNFFVDCQLKNAKHCYGTGVYHNVLPSSWNLGSAQRWCQLSGTPHSHITIKGITSHSAWMYTYRK